MKIRITVLLIALLGILGNVYSQVKMMDESDREIKKTIEEFIMKDILSSTVYRYDIDSGAVGTEAEKISKTVIDLSNRILSIITFYPNYSRTVVSFNESNDITDIIIYYADNSVMSRIKTNYDKNRKVSEKIYYFGSSYTFRIKNNYTSGKVSGQEYLDSAGKKLSYSKIFYDNADRLIEEDKYNQYDSLEITYSYLYDDRGNCTEEMITYPVSKIISKTEFKYNADNRVTEKISYGTGNKVTSRNILKYGDNGKLSEDSMYGIDEKLMNKMNFKYDENGNKAVWKYSDLNDEIEYLYRVVYNEK